MVWSFLSNATNRVENARKFFVFYKVEGKTMEKSQANKNCNNIYLEVTLSKYLYLVYIKTFVYIVSVCYVTSMFIDLMTNKLLLLYQYFGRPCFFLCRCKHERKTFKKSSQRCDVWEALNV